MSFVRRHAVAALCLMASLPTGLSQQDRKQFQLYNACRPMVSGVDMAWLPAEHESDPRLAKETMSLNQAREGLQDSLEGHLKKALESLDLHTEDLQEAGNSALGLRYVEIDGIVIITLKYFKHVTDTYGNSYSAPTWELEQHYRLPFERPLTFALDSMELQFLSDYYGVNSKDCGKMRPRPQ